MLRNKNTQNRHHVPNWNKAVSEPVSNSFAPPQMTTAPAASRNATTRVANGVGLRLRRPLTVGIVTELPQAPPAAQYTCRPDKKTSTAAKTSAQLIRSGRKPEYT